MLINLSKKDLEYIRRLVKDNMDYSKSYGFGGNDKLLVKLDKALDRK